MSKYAGQTLAYYFKDKRTGKVRNTAVFATNAEAAKNKLRRPAPEHAVVDTVRRVQPGEGKDGRWSRIRKDGKSPEQSAHGHGRGYGPPR
jgi:hypothetical protein